MPRTGTVANARTRLAYEVRYVQQPLGQAQQMQLMGLFMRAPGGFS